MPFQFSIRQAIRDSWNIFADNALFYIVLTVVIAVLNFVSRESSTIVSILVMLASFVWTYVFISATIAGVDGKQELLKLSAIDKHLPTFRHFLKLVGFAIVAGLISLLGLILLIIPGIYFMTRLAFSNFAVVDRKAGIRQSLRFSWELVKGNVFWTVFLTMVVSVLISIAGLVLVLVGFLVAYPISMLMMAKLCRALIAAQPAHDVVVQPLEIPAEETVEEKPDSPENHTA